MKTSNKLIKAMADFYSWLDRLITENQKTIGSCQACGQCCDFEKYDHRLYITTPELIYFLEHIAPENQKQMTTSTCPYNIDGKCTVYKYRFAACRIFCCKGDQNFQSDLSESALKKLKAICKKFNIEYQYQNLATALNKSSN
jgi:Fe-S-cluster containining protein